MFEKIAVMILAGGYGTRLHSVVPDLPKVLADVNGRPFLSYLLDQLCLSRVNSVIICTGYRGEMIVKAFQYKYKDLKLFFSKEPEPLGTAGALKFSLDSCNAEHILVMNGDSFLDTDLISFQKWHYQKRADCSLLLTHVKSSERYGFVKTDTDGRIKVFEEKGIEKSGWINAGVYIFRREIIASIPNNRMVSLENEIFPQLIGKDFYAFKAHGSFIDIGTPQSYEKAKEFFYEKYGDSGQMENKLWR